MVKYLVSLYKRYYGDPLPEYHISPSEIRNELHNIAYENLTIPFSWAEYLVLLYREIYSKGYDCIKPSEIRQELAEVLKASCPTKDRHPLCSRADECADCLSSYDLGLCSLRACLENGMPDCEACSRYPVKDIYDMQKEVI